MIIKASATLRNDYSTISNLTRATSEPIYITKMARVTGIYEYWMPFEKREQAFGTSCENQPSRRRTVKRSKKTEVSPKQERN